MKRLLSFLGVLLAVSPVMAQGSNNPLYNELLTKGLPLPEGPTVKLPTPLVKPGQALGNIEELLDKAAGKIPVDLFKRRTVTAPFSLKIESKEKEDGQRVGQMINLSFLAYGKLEDVLETDFIKQLLTGKQKPGKGGDVVEGLNPKELTQRGIELLKAPKLRDSYGKMTMELLEKVQVEGITRTVRTTLPRTVIYATRLDDRFQNDKEYPNRWRHIKDQDRLGPPQPYTGLGGYVVVTELPEPKGALLIEMHFFLHEPFDWFGGLPLLRSKLPIVIQDNVRNFRRKLMRE